MEQKLTTLQIKYSQSTKKITKKAKEAMEFITYITTGEFDKKMTEENSVYPNRQS